MIQISNQNKSKKNNTTMKLISHLLKRKNKIRCSSPKLNQTKQRLKFSKRYHQPWLKLKSRSRSTHQRTQENFKVAIVYALIFDQNKSIEFVNRYHKKIKSFKEVF